MPSTLQVSSDNGVVRIVLDSPPVNALGAQMMIELHTVLTGLREDPQAKVIVFSSANREFFSAHVDMGIGEQMDVLQWLAAQAPEGVSVFQVVGELIRNQPQVTIVKLAGKARGGGAEVVAAADLAFAALETAGLGQIESLMGIVPAGGGTQYLRQRMGRNRALEIVLTGELFDAKTAAEYGWINRAVPAVDLDAFVDRVARNIAALPEGVIAGVKQTLPPEDLTPGFALEQKSWAALIGRPEVQRMMAEALAKGAQTVEGERDLEGLMRSVTP
ncbi:enoyl-CoA hydratase/isomerase family protein [Actinoplanes sp. NPDC023936]|uniref:enoyl-CoA hydratase/isomerase family protein n=1 Tax=Actinoplanes sp. NPDC023936 TaxID=3154910 RepID=UPI0033C60B83